MMTVMRRRVPFLKAAWVDLIIASYSVPDAWVEAYLPCGLDPDRWNGQAYVSLVAFDFRQARVLGVTVPGLCTFPEVNLRTYARRGERRGVVFIAELVPTPIVAGMANVMYRERYRTARMTSRVTQVGDIRRVRHDFTVDGRQNTVAVTFRGPAETAGDHDVHTFFKERAWGFGSLPCGRAIEYSVSHPVWRTYDAEDILINVDFAVLYGSPWSALTGRSPDHVTVAEGSDVAVYPWQSITRADGGRDR